MAILDETHDAGRRSWLASANAPGSDFPIQNLPYGVFSKNSGERRIGVAIGDAVLDLTVLEDAGVLRPSQEKRVFAEGILNPFMALPQSAWTETRRAISALLDANGGDPHLPLIQQCDVRMHLPIFVRAFTDFYASREHATNVGKMFRDPQNALLPNWLHMPVGYNGRASTVVVSDTPIHRPTGQIKDGADGAPRFGPSEKLDFELEIGAIIGTASPMGHSLSTDDAYRNIFGYVLLNDWSARDIQVWEYQPLGPFLAKAFATTISPWVVTRDALEPFRVNAPERVKPLLPYLQETGPNNFDVELAVMLSTVDGAQETICRTNFRRMYYSSAQQLAHHTATGCAMDTGDLLGSGTISGDRRGEYGSLLELTWNGQEPISVGGTARRFLCDGDTVSMNGWCENPYRIGFGTCAGTILPARNARTSL